MSKWPHLGVLGLNINYIYNKEFRLLLYCRKKPSNLKRKCLHKIQIHFSVAGFQWIFFCFKYQMFMIFVKGTLWTQREGLFTFPLNPFPSLEAFVQNDFRNSLPSFILTKKWYFLILDPPEVVKINEIKARSIYKSKQIFETIVQCVLFRHFGSFAAWWPGGRNLNRLLPLSTQPRSSLFIGCQGASCYIIVKAFTTCATPIARRHPK